MFPLLRRIILGCLLLGSLPAYSAEPLPAFSLPRETKTKTSTGFEILNAGKTTGRLALPAGTTLAVVDVQDRFVLVQYRNLNGRVPIADTTLLPIVAMAAPPAAPAQTGGGKSATTAVASGAGLPLSNATNAANAAPINESSYAPATPMERLLTQKLVALEGGALRPFPTSRLNGVKFYAIYFSAGWCPPCREFTPEFMDAYTKLRAVYPEFETVLVNRDRSPAAMFEYMRDDKMKWPALSWDHVRGAQQLNAYAGAGIPCLVLVDENGKVLSDSYRWGRYVGPDAVLDDTWKILREYRRQNPRPKKS